jgi:zinc transporter ZupT
MIGYSLSVAGILVATLVPTYLSLYLITGLRIVESRYLSAAGIGLAFWFFYDTMGDAAQLDVNDSFYGGLAQLAIVLTFLSGILALAIFDYLAVPAAHAPVADAPRISRSASLTSAVAQAGGSRSSGANTENSQSSSSSLGPGLRASTGPRILYFLVPAGVAAVMGIHGLGEGWAFASTAAASSTTSIVTAFAGIYAVISYPLHKFLEAGIVACVYTVFVGRNGLARREWWHIPVLGVLFGLTSVVGAAIGYFVPTDTTYFYAFGVTSVIYAIVRLAEGFFKSGVSVTSSSVGIIPAYLGPKFFLAAAIGFFLLYVAALFH